ncbi:MAG: nucleotidyltransferase [Erysipelotrichaceae bacterium]|nr:nucleotidyltransferase [Erysipelotrichaceae bacterium]
MKKIGIIAEYNPIHSGHIYLLKKAKEQFPDSIIILITNSTFTQRGEVAILNKWDKTKLSLENNIDIVIELPFAYATQSADIFAASGLKILNYLQIDTLIFGSESNDIKKINHIAETQLNNPNYNTLVKQYLSKGNNYPTAMSKALIDILGYTITEPNDLLALSYIKEIKKNNYPITPFSIQRIGKYHGTKIETNIANASLIRKLLQQKKDITPYIPLNTKECLYNISNENYFPYLKYKILSSKDLSIYQTVEEGIENRIKKVIYNSNTWQDLVQNIKTKRYTYNKINRMLIHILTSFTKQEANNIQIDYIRILGFNLKGKNYLNQIKKTIPIPIITHYKKNISLLLDIELRATSIYCLPINKNLITKEINQKPIIKTNVISDKLDIHPDNKVTSKINQKDQNQKD